MPPLQDITHRFLSPLPPSSPALSYIDDVDFGGNDENIKTGDQPSSAFLALSTPSHAYHNTLSSHHHHGDYDKENKENLPPFELEDDFELLPSLAGPSNAVFNSTPLFPATPTSKANAKAKSQSKPGSHSDSPPSSDPFGFIAVERKLKLDRQIQTNKRSRPIAGPEPEPKRTKLVLNTSTPAVTRAALARRAITPAKPFKSLRSRVDKANVNTKTPVSRHAVDIRTLTPPPASPFHDEGRKRRRETLSFNDGNPFVDAVTSTPSPAKPLSRLHQPRAPSRSSVAVDEEEGGPEVGVERAPLSPTTNKRKRKRIGNDTADKALSTYAHDPDMLATILQSRLPKRTARERTKTKNMPTRKVKSVRGKTEEERAEEEQGEEDQDDHMKGKRRSTRLAVRESKAEVTEKEKSRKVVRKGKGKENAANKAGVNPKPPSSRATTTRTSSRTKAKKSTKGKEKEQDDESDHDPNNWDQERAARKAYFEKLDSYELETENIYVV